MEQTFGGDKDCVETQGEQADKEFNYGVSSEGASITRFFLAMSPAPIAKPPKNIERTRV
ncbi:MAG: hypothetical protein VB962_13060 [Pseudohongiellaceae bacterium]|jgi:hypothetical protein